jgi:hypothetical protein
MSAVGGDLVVSAGAGEIWEDDTIPANGQSITDFKIKNDDSGNAIAQALEIIRIKSWNGSSLVNVWMTVQSVGADLGGYREYNCVVGSGGSATVQKGMAVVNYGSPGASILQLQAGTISRLRVATHSTDPWTTQTNMVVLGDLYDTYGAGTNHRYGLGLGDYSSGNYLSFNADGSNSFELQTSDGGLRIAPTGITLYDNADNVNFVTFRQLTTEERIGDLYADYGGGDSVATFLRSPHPRLGIERMLL